MAVTSCGLNKTVCLEDVSAVLQDAHPGDIIYVKNGLYRDLSLQWEGKGTEVNPIVVIAI